MPRYYLKGILRTLCVFTKKKLMPPRGDAKNPLAFSPDCPDRSVTTVSLRGSESRRDEMEEEREAFFDFGSRSSQPGVWGHQPPSSNRE
jgi:hypothetical protein